MAGERHQQDHHYYIAIRNSKRYEFDTSNVHMLCLQLLLLHLDRYKASRRDSTWMAPCTCRCQQGLQVPVPLPAWLSHTPGPWRHWGATGQQMAASGPAG